VPNSRTDTRTRITLAATLLLAVAVPATASASVSDTRKCIAALLANTGTLAKCLYKTEARFFSDADRAKRDEAAAKCDTKFQFKGLGILDKYGAACPGNGDAVASLPPAMFRLDELVFGRAWAQSVTGGDMLTNTKRSLSNTVTRNETEFATQSTTTGTVGLDKTLLSPLISDPTADSIRTALTSSGSTVPVVPPPLGTSFLSTGTGTAIDEGSGLEWELKTTDSSVHDVSNVYPYTGTCVGIGTAHPGEACKVNSYCSPGNCTDVVNFRTIAGNWVAALNLAAFAGHADWRIPTQAELRTLKREPCGSSTPPCTALPGPTRIDPFTLASPALYWTTDLFLAAPPANPFQEYTVSFVYAGTHNAVSDDVQYLRAVRTKFTP